MNQSRREVSVGLQRVDLQRGALGHRNIVRAMARRGSGVDPAPAQCLEHAKLCTA
uniref:Uncharacterized protein n=1 Tax=Arundo donax TaxID=35708 RepID=A0A0A9EED8_ARUDO